MRTRLPKLLILLAVVGLIAAPALFSASGEVRRADAALASGRPLEAAASLERASVLLFWRADLTERAGRAAFAGRDFASAARLLASAKSLSVDGWRDLGAAYYTLGRFDDSVDALEHGLEIYGPQTALLRQLALARNAQGDFEGELAALQEFIALDGSDAAVRHRAGLLLAVYDPNEALAELTASAKLDAQYDPEFQTMRSALNLAFIETDEARRLTVIGRGLGLVQEWTLAREAFQRAVRVDGENAEAWAWLGEADQHLGQDGSEALARAASLDPFSASVRALYGLYWKRRDDPQRALVQFQWAAAIEPNNPAYLASLGDAYAFAGELPSALAAYKQAADLAPTEAAYWRMLAAFCAQYHFAETETGIPAAQRALKLAPDEAASYDLLGWMYLAAGQHDEAEKNLLEALRLDPDDAAAHLHLGMTYLELNRLDEARQQLSLAYSLDADGADGEAAQKLLALYFP